LAKSEQQWEDILLQKFGMHQAPSNKCLNGAILTQTENYPIMNSTLALTDMKRLQPPELQSKHGLIKIGQSLTPTKTDKFLFPNLKLLLEDILLHKYGMDQNPSNNFSIGAILTKTINYPIVK
jgi:hypothetical protein